jgi:putative ABC transport system permease protein
MLRNYLTIAYRNIVRNKAFSFINIFGLAVGLATYLVIMLYIFEEAGTTNLLTIRVDLGVF